MKKINFKQTEIGKIPKDWDILSINDVAEVVGGGTPSTREPNNFSGEIPWITPKDLSNFHSRYISKGERNITKKGLEESSAKLLPPNSVLLTTRAPVGYVAIAKNEVTTNQGFRSLIPRQNANAEYLYYLLKINTERLKSNASGTTFGELSGSTLKSLKFPFPPIAEQRAIAKILSDLDEKIELNHQMNKTLESIAQALFKRWFVDFEFPGYEKTKIVNGFPEGWRMGKFGELAKIQPGFAFKSTDFTSSGYRVIKIANIQSGIVDFTQSDHVTDIVFQSVDKKFYLTSGDVIIAMTGAKIGKIGIIPKTDEITLLNQRVGKLVGDYYLWAYCMLKGAEIQALIDGISSASSAQPNISNSDIEKTEVVIPDTQTLKYFCQIGNTFFQRLISNLGENKILSQIRDSLLPKLISGKIRVN